MKIRCGLLVALILAGCKAPQPQPTTPPLPPPAPFAPPKPAAPEAMVKRRVTYALGFSMPYPLPQSGVSFEVWQSNSLTGNVWSLWVSTNNQPVPLARNQPQQYFKVRALQNGLYSGWAIQGGASTTNPPVISPASTNITLGWTASTGTNIAGYNIYDWGPAGRTNETAVGNVVQATVPLLPLTNTFAATALDTAGRESDKSATVTYVAVTTTNYPPPTPSNLTIFPQ